METLKSTQYTEKLVEIEQGELTMEFDKYYVIICSRGPLTDTVMVEKINECILENIDGLPIMEEQFEKFHAAYVDGGMDEGFVVAVPKGTFNLCNIARCIMFCDHIIVGNNYDVTTTTWEKFLDTFGYDPDVQGAVELLKDVPRDAYSVPKSKAVSAIIRAFMDLGSWTSFDGWRGDKLSPKQCEIFLEAVGGTADEWTCNAIPKEEKRV